MQSVRKTIGGLGNLMFKEAYLIGQMLDGAIPDVYLQGEKYWLKHKNLIKASYSEGIGPQIDKVALHIRRGDYLKAHHFHVNLWETEYYKKAIALFPDDTQFIVFCKDNQGWEQDKADRQWCRDNLTTLIGERFELPPKENTEEEDFNLMASCESVIMANSSFSWWAAYLGSHDKIICPRTWFVDEVQRTELLADWILL